MKAFTRYLFLFLLLLFSRNIVFAQTNSVEASSNGFIIKKLVSNTTITSGTIFTYTIFYSIPAGSSGIVITDNIPANLVIDGVVSSPVCGTPTVTTSGNTVTYSLASVASACSGSFQINVHFPAGVTCNGDKAENQVCLEAQGLEKLCTERLRVTAKAENPFVTYKQVIAGINPDASSSCGHIAVVDDTINYKICVLKKSPFYGNIIGQQNLDNAVITDVLPAGAVLISSSCGATQTGSTITWNVGNLNAATPYVYTCCNFQVYYPAGTFPVGTMINNKADLTGDACGVSVDTFSNTTCVLLQEPLDSATFSKSVYLSNNVPGCNGFYRITTCNKGNVDLDFNITDMIPSGVTVTSINAFFGAGVTGSYDFTANGGAITLASGATSGTSYSVPMGTTISDINFDYNNLDPGQCAYITIYFTIDIGATGTITNCANLNSPTIGNLQACVDFDIGNTAPKLCLQKEVCNPQSSYSAGDIVRYRLRIQNIGSETLTGANLQDLLDPNLSYVPGTETYYIGSSYNTPCAPNPMTLPTGTSAWTGVSTAHAGNNLTWNLPDIDSDCQAFYHGYCGAYGISSLPFYFIEFDVMVNDDAAAGVVPNNFSGQGGNLPIATTSNTATIVVNAIYGMELNKLISTDGGATFADTALTSAGTNVIYRLAFKNT
ncbi:MAG TPA: hypothetical protein ENK52_01445, partial [Saprospiraceae bacterium]|nr:hypothetical protein [Saprospiraceae bacterium]